MRNINIKYNFILLFSLFVNVLFFVQTQLDRALDIYDRNFVFNNKDIFILLIFLPFTLLFLNIIFIILSKRFAISITDESIKINLIGQIFRGKILKEEIEDVIYYPKTKQIGINLKNSNLFLTKVRSPIVRYFIRRNIKKNKSHIYIKSDFTTQNITEIKIILDELGYSTESSKTNILKLNV